MSCELCRLAELLKLQVTVGRCAARVIDVIRALSVHGAAKSEGMASIIRDWLRQNEEKLRRGGVCLGEGFNDEVRTEDG